MGNLTVEQAAEILGAAFAPLRCVAEPWDYRSKVRFRVFDAGDQPLLRQEDLTRSQVADPRRLESAIAHARSNLAHRGYELAPWVFPAIS